MAALSWSLVVATYARHEVLAVAVGLAARQSRPPREIVVVDGSVDWESGRARVAASLSEAGYRGTLRYEPAVALGLPQQRNQAISLASGDVLFLLDDDSLTYPDCAERVMEAYEADASRAVVGVGPVHVEEPPPGARGVAVAAPARGGLRARLERRLERVAWRGTGFFLPYDDDFPTHAVPPECAALGARPVRVLDGFRMTFRRSVFESLAFEEMLRHYAVSEDQDFSYRASRLGALVELPTARLHHAAAVGGRLSPRTVTTLRWCNRVALRVVHGGARGRVARKLAAALPLHVAISFLQDLVRGDAGLARTRGVLAAIPRCVSMLRLPAERVRATYPAFQARLLGRESAS